MTVGGRGINRGGFQRLHAKDSLVSPQLVKPAEVVGPCVRWNSPPLSVGEKTPAKNGSFDALGLRGVCLTQDIWFNRRDSITALSESATGLGGNKVGGAARGSQFRCLM